MSSTVVQVRVPQGIEESFRQTLLTAISAQLKRDGVDAEAQLREEVPVTFALPRFPDRPLEMDELGPSQRGYFDGHHYVDRTLSEASIIPNSSEATSERRFAVDNQVQFEPFARAALEIATQIGGPTILVFNGRPLTVSPQASIDDVRREFIAENFLAVQKGLLPGVETLIRTTTAGMRADLMTCAAYYNLTGEFAYMSVAGGYIAARDAADADSLLEGIHQHFRLLAAYHPDSEFSF